MIRIGITQHIEKVPNRTELRDCLDVNWSKLLRSLNLLPIPLCSNVENFSDYLAALNLDGYILSGGNNIGDMPKRDALEFAILEHSIVNHLPVLGVCRGMQFINQFLGGKNIRVKGHVSSIHDNLIGDWVVKNNITKVNSFHNFAVFREYLGNDLIVLAEAEDGVVETIRHKFHPWLGIMWHPEREPHEVYNSVLIKNHFNS